MIQNIKLKLILCMILAALALTGIVFNEFGGKYAQNNYNSKSEVVSELNDASGDWYKIDLAVVGRPGSIFIGDVNNDGYNDIATTNGGSYTISILVWNSSSGDWNPQIDLDVGYILGSIFVGDANNDGYNDMIVVNIGFNIVSIFLWNNASGDWNPKITRAVGGQPRSVSIGDVNNDGYNDITTANQISYTVSILLWNNTSGDWNPQISRSVGPNPVSLFTGDANNDGYIDIITANADSDTVSILLWNNTSGDWESQINRAVGGELHSVFLGDANNDGYNDITTANSDSDTVSILLWNNTSGDWTSQITRAVGDYPMSVFIGDANNDGCNDIATANEVSDTVSILLWNNTLGDWNPQITRAVGYEPMLNQPISVFIGDANNDGYNDIANTNVNSGTVSVLIWKPSPINPTISIITPNASSSWVTNTSHYIFWTSTGNISNVRIELYKEGVFVIEIDAGTPNDGSATWVLPSELEDSTQYQIKISDASNSSIYDFSDNFEIKNPSKNPSGIPGYELYLIIGIICIVSVFLFKMSKIIIKDSPKTRT